MIITEQDYLEHHGVLGMKWGVHRAKQWNKAASRASAKAKTVTDKAQRAELNSKSNAYSQRANKILKKHERLAGGKKAFEYTKNQSTGKAIVKSLLMGSYGASQYNKSRAYGRSVARSLLSGYAGAFASTQTGSLASIVNPRAKAYLRETPRIKSYMKEDKRFAEYLGGK